MKRFLKPLTVRRFWVGLLACIILLPLPFAAIAGLGISAADEFTITKLLVAFFLVQFYGMILPAVGCFLFGIPVYLFFEFISVRSKYYYMLAGALSGFAFPIFLVGINSRMLSDAIIFTPFGVVAALIFWYIVIRPLPNK